MQQNTSVQVNKDKNAKLNSLSFREYSKKYGAFAVLVLLILLNMFVTPNFTSVKTMWNLLIQVSTVMLVALGMTIVISAGGIDISVGSTMAISSIVGAKLLGLGVFPAIIISLAIAAVLGLFNGFIIAYFKVQPIIITLTMMIAGRGIAQVINDGQLLNFTNAKFSYFGIHKFGGVLPIQVVIMLVAIGVIYFVLRKMAFGRYVQAMGDNYDASRLAGINTFLTTLMIYAVCAVLAGAAGLMETARLSAADGNAIGKAIELDAIAAVVVGGTPMTGGKANIAGTVIGALIIELITVAVNMNNIPFAYSLVIKSLIVIVAVYIQRERAR